jgi:hypothetical protein
MRSMKVAIWSKRLVVLAISAIAAGGTFGARGDLTGTNAADMLATLTGTTSSSCEGLLTNLTGVDPSTLLDGFSDAEGEEFMEVVADLMGLSPSPGTHNGRHRRAWLPANGTRLAAAAA